MLEERKEENVVKKAEQSADEIIQFCVKKGIKMDEFEILQNILPRKIRMYIEYIRSTPPLSSQSPERNKKSAGSRKMSEEEIKYRAMTLRERQAVKWALSLEKNSEALKTIKKLS